ncbi:MAG TPA: hypothetical protein HA327_05285, partial [Candidatus Poseidoniaceae archaeon]
SIKSELHVGKLLSSNFPDGLAGGHKSLGGGQIPLDIIAQRGNNTEQEHIDLVMAEMKTMLHRIFIN